MSEEKRKVIPDSQSSVSKAQCRKGTSGRGNFFNETCYMLLEFYSGG